MRTEGSKAEHWGRNDDEMCGRRSAADRKPSSNGSSCPLRLASLRSATPLTLETRKRKREIEREPRGERVGERVAGARRRRRLPLWPPRSKAVGRRRFEEPSVPLLWISLLASVERETARAKTMTRTKESSVMYQRTCYQKRSTSKRIRRRKSERPRRGATRARESPSSSRFDLFASLRRFFSVRKTNPSLFLSSSSLFFLPDKIGRGALLGGTGGDSAPTTTGAVMALRGVAEVRTEAFREIRWGRFH